MPSREAVTDGRGKRRDVNQPNGVVDVPHDFGLEAIQ